MIIILAILATMIVMAVLLNSFVAIILMVVKILLENIK
jgi:hypothetical protein